MRFQKTRSQRVSQAAEQELTVRVCVHERIHVSVYGDGRQGDTCSKCQAGILQSFLSSASFAEKSSSFLNIQQVQLAVIAIQLSLVFKETSKI